MGGARWTLVLGAAIVGTLSAAPAARADRLPSPADCAAGSAAPLTLGEYKGALALCAGPLYAGGNLTIPCGTIVAAGTPAVGTPDDDPADDCDAVDPLDNVVRYRVGLPPGYASQPKRRWPTIYLLPGGGGNERSWETFTDIVPQVAATGVIVVLPYGGLTFHTNWETGQNRAYERSFIERLIPDVDGRYRTLADRAHRAIGGFSRGGFGAMLMTARHPDLFAAAGAFSGAVDPLGELREEQLLLTTQYMLSGPSNQLISRNPWFGDPVGNELGWRERSPVELARALRGTRLWISSGDGTPAGADTSDPLFALGTQTELQIMLSSATFDRALTALGIPHHYDVHGGTHSYVHAGADAVRWARALQATGFSLPARPTFDLRNADPSFGAYGWTFEADNGRAPEFLDVTGAGRGGVTLTGSGRTRVTTAPLFRRGQTVTVLVNGVRYSTRADRAGRLRFFVSLGPAHRQQQFTRDAARAQQRPTTVRLAFKV